MRSATQSKLNGVIEIEMEHETVLTQNEMED